MNAKKFAVISGALGGVFTHVALIGALDSGLVGSAIGTVWLKVGLGGALTFLSLGALLDANWPSLPKKLAIAILGTAPFALFVLIIVWRIALARETLQKCLDGDAAACVDGGKRKLKRGEIDQATVLFTRGCELNDSGACMEMGAISERAGQVENAAEYFDRGCEGDNALSCERAAQLLKHDTTVVDQIFPRDRSYYLDRACALGRNNACHQIQLDRQSPSH